MTEFFSHVFPYAVWRVLPHPAPGRNEWAVELRDVPNKETNFALIDLAEPALRWQTRPEAADWWTTLTALADDQLFLHNYRFPDLPEPTDLLSLSTKDGLLSWAAPNHIFVKVLDEANIVVATRQQDKVLYKQCHLENGRLATLAEEEMTSTTDSPAYRVPIRYRKGDVYFETLSSFLDKTVNTSGVTVIDYLEASPYIAFSYYIYEKEKIAQYIVVINRKREILYHTCLVEGREGVGRDTMLFKDETLVFLRNSNEFVGIKLSS
ncbi:DUF4905 domain-containing protein [Telluribacter sp.]|uniref:DUF4905 domain-containing protein n=1 Tax=Telluribacter sp. TaxID=1978767 RepID=UPI002E0DB144|nr:DUF4905 domain-containing protein [Telluribacter sp.]